jgi:hypothetical protein
VRQKLNCFGTLGRRFGLTATSEILRYGTGGMALTRVTKSGILHG